MKQQLNEIKRMQRLAGLITESEYQKSLAEEQSSDDLAVKWTKRYLDNEKKDPYFYNEKGLLNGFEMVDGKKVKEIIGYFDDTKGDEDSEVIGYVYSKSGKDIETEYNKDDLDNAFTSALN